VKVGGAGCALRAGVDLPAYLRRTGYEGDLDVRYAALEGLHLAHATRIPFENLDILLRRPIRLDPASLQAKLVAGRRGGYCFEQNTLFAAVLEALGFPVRRLAARVRGPHRVLRPRTHMLLLVELDEGAWIADVGFGVEGLLLPVPFQPGRVARQFAWSYRVLEEGEQYVLQSRGGDGWRDLYAFTLEPQEAVDYEVANWFTSTHPDSPFVNTLTVQLGSPEARYTLRNRELSVDTGAEVARRTLAGDEEFLEVLAGTFGLRFPPGTRFAFREPDYPSNSTSGRVGSAAPNPGPPAALQVPLDRPKRP